MKTVEVIVVGLGAMGSATTYQLAKRGCRVLGIDQFSPPHIHGSTHGGSRITRQAIGEGFEYIPFALRSHEIWREIEQETKTDLLTITGGLFVGEKLKKTTPSHLPAKKNFIQQTIVSAETFHIPHEVLEYEELVKRFPQFHFQANNIALYEYGAGFLRPEACVASQISLAKKYGADIHVDEKVVSFFSEGNGVIVRTNKESYKADRIILTVGPWINELFPRHAETFRVYRQVLFWFDVQGPIEPFLPQNFPVYIFDFGPYDDFYGFPAIDGPGGGIKMGLEDSLVTTPLEEVKRTVDPDETKRMYDLAVKRIPHLANRCVRTTTCLYTVTPDSKFVIDTHPSFENVIIASPCSGHGFKHSAAIGETLAEIALTGKSRISVEAFRLNRLS